MNTTLVKEIIAALKENAVSVKYKTLAKGESVSQSTYAFDGNAAKLKKALVATLADLELDVEPNTENKKLGIEVYHEDAVLYSYFEFDPAKGTVEISQYAAEEEEEEEDEGENGVELEFAEVEVDSEVRIVDDEGEEFIGTVTKKTKSGLTIEDQDGESHTFKSVDVAIYSADKEEDDEDEEVDSDDEALELADIKVGTRIRVEDEEGESVVGTVTKKTKAGLSIEDEDEEVHAFKASEVTFYAAPEVVEDDEEEEEDEEELEAEGEQLEFADVEVDAYIKVEDEEGEIVVGTVTKKTKAGLTVEDDDGETHTFKAANITIYDADGETDADGNEEDDNELIEGVVDAIAKLGAIKKALTKTDKAQAKALTAVITSLGELLGTEDEE